MSPIRVAGRLAIVFTLLGVSACGDKEIIEDCSEKQAYELIVPGKRVVVPEGLDSLDDYREMPIPKAETPPQPDDGRCLDAAPAIRAESSDSQ